MAVDGGGRGLQEGAQAGDGGIGVIIGAQLGGQDGGVFIAGTQLEGGVQFRQPTRYILGDDLGACQGQVRLRALHVVRGDALQRGHGADGVGALGHLLLQLQDGVGALAGRHLVQLRLQHRLDFRPLARGDQQELLHLARRHGGRRQLDPQPRGGQRLRGRAGQEGDFSRALGEARVARVLRQIQVGAVCRLDQPTLQRDFRRQHAVHDVLVECDRRQIGALRTQQATTGARALERDGGAVAGAAFLCCLGDQRGCGSWVCRPCRQACQSSRNQRGEQDRSAARKSPRALHRWRTGESVGHGLEAPEGVQGIVA